MDQWLEHFARATFLRSSDTAHDLKTPLNVAVLNLELLRMRLRKLVTDDSEKAFEYANSIESELRRMARIFDVFFLHSIPPKGEGEPEPIDLCALCRDAGASAGYEIVLSGPVRVRVHESRIRQALKLFFEGAAKILKEGEASSEKDGRLNLAVRGSLLTPELELTKIFKFYYTDPSGEPDLSLATARLIVETYGGELNAVEESGKVTLRMSLPVEGP